MHPLTLPAMLALGLLVPVAASSSASPPPKRAPAPLLRGADCLEPARARGYISLDERSLLVDAGRNLYRIEVAASCWNLDFANVVAFRGDPISNRVCGSRLDALVIRGNPPCRIERMERLDRETYQRLQKEHEAALRASREAKRRKSGTP